jgi:iron(III) transport system permease protein
MRRLGPILPALLLCAVVMLPLLAVLGLAVRADDGWWAHLADTVLLEYVLTTLGLVLGVGLVALVVGTGAAWLVTMYRFPGRDVLDWALVLPLAMPTYVLAYAYTDFLQFTGPLQTAIRSVTGWGWRDYWFPSIHSLGGAITVLSLALYPYVYVTARAAFVEQASCALEVSRTLGCGPFAAFWRVAVPMARPSLAAGTAFVLMEALADFGAVRFFEVPTFTTGIYRAWYAMGSPGTAAQLGVVLMLFVLGAILLERANRGRASFAGTGIRQRPGEVPRLRGPAGLLALLATVMPLLLGFVLPAIVLATMATGAGDTVSAARLLTLTRNTILLAGIAVLVILPLAILAVYAGRSGGSSGRLLLRLASMGYAVPGVVIAVGLLVAISWVDHTLSDATTRLWGADAGLFLGGTIVAVLYGYLVRFFAVAWTPLDAGMSRIRGHVEDAARTLGCTPLALLGRIHLPLLRASLLGAALLVFVDVMKELPATMILRPFNFDTLAVETFQLATSERLDGAAVPSLLIVATGLIPIVLLCRVLRSGRREPV